MFRIRNLRICDECLHRLRIAPLCRRNSSLAAVPAHASKTINFSSYFFANGRQRIEDRVETSSSPLETAPVSQNSQETATGHIQFKGAASSVPWPPTDVAYRPLPPMTVRLLAKNYMALSKARLTSLIVLTAMSGYALSPLPGSIPVLLSTALGTTLCCASANTLNQMQEVPFDAQMVRTRSRPLVRQAITPLHAFGFASATGVVGVGLLATFVNPLTACLGALNIGLYAGLYTHMKRTSIANTWVGAVVGAIPPLMGWAACGGALIPSSTSPIALYPPQFLEAANTASQILPADNPLAAWTLALLLFSWQFPHFNSLSLMLASSYARAGFRMLSVVSPSRNAAVCLRHAILLLPVCSVLVPLSGLTDWGFAITSLAPNIVAVRAAWKFWSIGSGTSEAYAKAVWRISLWWLPVILALMMAHKRSTDWSSFWSAKEEETKIYIEPKAS
ncbi:protoheme IX farnesyltransferase [Sistotremastrum suecicum HHB10207 ss-3]|uniref:Protoheme IX farnesyltransferase, mitochondrial n=1 Tax=Sistotremastrum suecicum HHB10207 ss-3 TaxID=1314776 RepID=A0A166G3L2_9AGAM|nr:protoheme IX farnesyltransferase [Sistotremastrum suecicum HHB10207 ss-3]